MSSKEDVRSKGERRLLPQESSESNSESGAETDDEASSTSDFPSHLGSTGMTGLSITGQTSSAGLEMSGGESGSLMVDRVSQLDIAKEVPPQRTSAVPPCSRTPLITGASPSVPTLQLPVDSSGEESNGGNEPDVSASVSESEGNITSGNLHQNDGLLPLPRRSSQPSNHGNGSDDSESSLSEESGQEELEDLSHQNHLHRPHRDKTRNDDVQSDSLSVATALSTTTSYLHGENASDRVRHLVKRTISKKMKQRQRQGRPKKETKAPSAAGRRGKKTNRNAVKQSMDTTLF